MQDVHVHILKKLVEVDQPMSTEANVAMALEVTFLNSAVDSVGRRRHAHDHWNVGRGSSTT